MDINTSIYGAPDTWYTPTGTYGARPATKLPTWGDGYYNHYYYGGFDEGVFTANGAPVDNSLALWGVNKNAPFARPYFFFPTLAVDSNYVYTTDPEVHTYNVLTAENTTLPMTTAVYGSGLSVRANSMPDYQYTPNAATPFTWFQAACQPILDFKYNNIVLLPVIIAARDTTGSDDSGLDFAEYSITDYFDNGGQSTYPYIVAVNANVYISTSSTNSRTENNDALKYWYSKEYAAHVSSWEGIFSKYSTAYYSVQPMNIIRISGGYGGGVDSSRNYNFNANESFTTIPEAFARFSLTGYNDSPAIVLDNGKYQYKVIDNRGYCTVTTIWENATKDEVLQEVAYLGFWFCDDSTAAINAANGQSCTSDKMHIPLFDENGITTGDWKSGLEAAAIAPADDDTARDIAPDYDPNAGSDIPDADSGDLSNAGNYLHKFGAEGLTIWAFYRTSLGGNGLDAAINAITDLYLTDPDGNEKWQLDFKGSNPDEYIVSLMAFPLRFSLSESSYTFKLGPVDFEGIDVKKYADTGFFTFGSITVPAYGDFRDFAPYTTAELYIPFCGTCDIDMAFFAGRDLIVDMYYDIYTGSCAAAIYRYTALGKTLYKTINGQIGVEIPLSAARMGDYQSTLHALETAQKQNDIRIATSVLGMGITAGATIATGGATLPLLAAGVASTMGVVSSVQKSEEINYQLEHTQPKPTQTTAASTQNNYCVGGTRCMLFIKRAHMDSGYNADVYGRTKGYACLLNNTVNDNSGLTVCSNIDTSNIPATADEINAIKQAFASGVIT